MTEKNNNKKLAKLKERVYNLLENCRHNDESKMEPTHQSYGIFRGVFALDKSKKKEFMELYTKAINAGVTDFSILERQKEFAPIIIDIDLELPSDNYQEGTRLYDNNLVINIIRKYVESINTYLKIKKKNELKSWVFEKAKPQNKDETVKDGFHIMFPDVCARTNMRHLIRMSVVKMCAEDGTLEGFTNGPDKIIDKAVVSSNGWFLYGSAKPNGTPYKLTSIYNKKLKKIYDHQQKMSYETDNEGDYELDDEAIIKFLSVQSKTYTKKNLTKINDDYVDSDINAECEKLGINSMVKAEELKLDIPISKEDDVRRACRFTSMLADSRASDYHDWMHVGLALHNIDDSLLPSWIEFSKKCPRKYKEGECERIWRTMKNPGSGNILTIRSLAYWAKQDDPKQFEAFNKEEFKIMMKKSLNGNTYYLAKSIHTKYSGRFVCSNISKNIWWEFRNHRWVRVQDGYTLKIELSEGFANEYNKEIADTSLKITQVNGFEREELQTKRKRLEEIVDKLMNTTFKDLLIKECKNLFYDDKFEQKLDSNINLLGFENGVFDLEKGEFREGRPDDYLTMSTKHNYNKWSERNPYYGHINKFFREVFPIERVRKYFLIVLSTCISGNTKEEKFYIMTGSGSNGKSLTNDLMKVSLGDYYMSCDVSLITRKRGQSNQAAPEKVRMKGRRYGVFQEADDGEKMNVGVVKEMTGGDVLTIRDLFKGADEMIEFKPQMKFFLTANQLPEVPTTPTDDSPWRRIRVVDFVSKFIDDPNPNNNYEFLIDRTLKDRLLEWGSAFISYLIHVYLHEYKTQTKIIEPEEVIASTQQYRKDNDTITEYFIERITKTDNSKDTIGKDKLWKDFREWYINTFDTKDGPKRPDIMKFFTKELGEPTKKGFTNIVFTQHEEEEATNNDFDV